MDTASYTLDSIKKIKLNTANMKRGTANAASIVTLALTPGADALSLVGLVFFTCLFDIAAFPF